MALVEQHVLHLHVNEQWLLSSTACFFSQCGHVELSEPLGATIWCCGAGIQFMHISASGAGRYADS